MTKILHVLTRENDDLAEAVISRQRQEPGQQVQTVDLADGQPGYPALLEKIFEADSVEVW